MIAKAWSDESFKERLTSDPKAVLEAEGISVPKDVNISVVEQSEKQIYLVIPQRQDDIAIDIVEERKAASAVGCIAGHCIMCWK
ncbi:MAG: NHLP leader peptide family RiPP precursor [Deltaproteobacteria bacterium]|nr:NHLP leader peptide family RiPP precursor [Deltaproteobacteria bacterium]